MQLPNVFTISAGSPFLETLVDALFSGRFGAVDGADPFALANVTILLPTRRSARALSQILVRRSSARVALLPRIRPIADVDEEEHLLAGPDEAAGEGLTLPPAVSHFDRTIALTELIMAWARAVRGGSELGAREQELVPGSAAEALGLAEDLAKLIDDMATAGIGWDVLKRLPPDEYAGYWQTTLGFLRIAGEQWPKILEDLGRADPTTRRYQLLRASAERLRTTPPRAPIIAAGSTGSIPATAALLKAISMLPNGAVVLPGLDQSIDQAGWDAIGDPTDPAAGAPSHPQHGLKRLLAEIGIDRADVVPLGESASAPAARSALIAQAMRPAETTEKWADTRPVEPEALAEVALVTARNEHEEALAIAVALREFGETGQGTAALVTPDRMLARRVGVELQRWHIRADDSSGRPLDATPEAVFVRLLADAAMRTDVTALLALAKHPTAGFGMPRPRCRQAAKALEIVLLRGTDGQGSVRSLSSRLVDLRLRMDMKADRFVARAKRRLGKRDWALAEALAAGLGAALGPLEEHAGNSVASVAETTRLLSGALDAAADDGSGSGPSLWSGRAGEALAALLSGLLGASRLRVAPEQFPAFLTAAMAGVIVTPEPAADSRIHIWGTLEARLQSVDLMILGGLDEGIWPSEIRTDAWVSRRMRNEMGLPPPERRIGQAAHDFTQAMANSRVIITRAERRGGAPTVASRWLQRLIALSGHDGTTAISKRGTQYLQLARRLDAVAPADVMAMARPAPTPRVDARPRELSITSIENLIRDPYSIYARRILQLEPLDPIGQRADARLRGSLIHEALADFTREWRGVFDDQAKERFLALWRRRFSEIEAYPEVHVVWMLRAEPIADWLVAWEAGRSADVRTRHPEVAGEHVFETPMGPFRLTGRADRIDELRDGRISIFDYKTGALATPAQVLLFQPQLALEGAMAGAGAFGSSFKDRSIAELAWIGLARIGKGDIVRSAVDEGTNADGLAAEALVRLKDLIIAYENPATGYISQARPLFERRFPGDYDHLARVSEWRNAVRAADS